MKRIKFTNVYRNIALLLLLLLVKFSEYFQTIRHFNERPNFSTLPILRYLKIFTKTRLLLNFAARLLAKNARGKKRPRKNALDQLPGRKKTSAAKEMQKVTFRMQALIRDRTRLFQVLQTLDFPLEADNFLTAPESLLKLQAGQYSFTFSQKSY